jgi:hypothetical protein
MVQIKSPRIIWDFAIEFESIVRSLDLVKLDNEVSETIMMGHTADISFICDIEWFSWVYFKDKDRAQFPDQKVVFGQYLGSPN